MNTRSLIIQCNNICPCFCPGCYNFFSNKQIPLQDIICFLNGYKELFGLSRVTLSGGDPLLSDNISYLINHLNQSKISITIDSVGSIFLEKLENDLISSLKMISMLGLPLDGVCDKTIQLFRQKLTFEGCMSVIENSREYVKSICINTVAHAGNTGEIKSIAELINRLPFVSKWQVFQYMPIGPRGFDNKKIYAISNTEFCNIETYVTSLKLRDTLHVEFKSIITRKDKYLILGADGLLWLPEIGPNRIILGSIYDENIFDKIKLEV